jgi:tRNA-Thr(GGU) m(6)t(6)A37 methyltransferase TsaA
MNNIIIEPIGVIHSPYIKPEDVPIKSELRKDVEAYVDIKKEYTKGLQDLDGFSHIIIIFNFHLSKKIHLKSKPSFEKYKHGIFSTRSPHRPNHIGLSIVKIQRIEKNKIFFAGADMINNTPVLDIKPYVKDTDSKDEVICGWLENHIKKRKINVS